MAKFVPGCVTTVFTSTPGIKNEPKRALSKAKSGVLLWFDLKMTLNFEKLLFRTKYVRKFRFHCTKRMNFSLFSENCSQQRPVYFDVTLTYFKSSVLGGHVFTWNGAFHTLSFISMHFHELSSATSRATSGSWMCDQCTPRKTSINLALDAVNAVWSKKKIVNV